MSTSGDLFRLSRLYILRRRVTVVDGAGLKNPSSCLAALDQLVHITTAFSNPSASSTDRYSAALYVVPSISVLPHGRWHLPIPDPEFPPNLHISHPPISPSQARSMHLSYKRLPEEGGMSVDRRLSPSVVAS